MDRYSTTERLRIATAGIVSPKEREQAKQELADHIFDHTEALLSTGLSHSQAQQQAVAAMGDPKAVGKHLRRVHQPILTCLLRVTRWAVIALAVVTVWSTLLFSDWGSWINRYIPARPEKHRLEQLVPDDYTVHWGTAVCPDTRVQAGDYTVSFRYVTAAQNAESSVCVVDICLLFIPRFFWQEDASPQPLFVLRDTAGHTWNTTQPMAKGLRTVSYPGHRQVELYAVLDFFPEDGQLELEYTGSGYPFTLPIDLTGGVVYEK